MIYTSRAQDDWETSQLKKWNFDNCLRADALNCRRAEDRSNKLLLNMKLQFLCDFLSNGNNNNTNNGT
jgi:hypothetical protein